MFVYIHRGVFFGQLWEYIFTSIREVSQAAMGVNVYFHRGDFAGSYGSIFLHPSRRFCRHAAMKLYCYIHQGGFARNHKTFFMDNRGYEG